MVNEATGGEGQLWETDARSEPVVSADDYEARCAAMLADPVVPVGGGGVCHRMARWHDLAVAVRRSGGAGGFAPSMTV
ncbi:MAG: hypothetical protein WDM96_19400 [Lacunisphaera sp.]